MSQAQNNFDVYDHSNSGAVFGDWPKEKNKQRFTYKADVIDPETKKRISKTRFATVNKEIDEVRYLLSDAFGTQKAVKIGFHNGKLKIHLRNYKQFTNKSPGYPIPEKGYTLNY